MSHELHQPTTAENPELAGAHVDEHVAHVHVVPPWFLLIVFGALLLLTFITVAVTWVDFGRTGNVWVALTITTPLAKSQIAAGWPVAVQAAVPVIGLVGWLAAKELARSTEAQARSPDSHGSDPVQPDQLSTLDTPRP